MRPPAARPPAGAALCPCPWCGRTDALRLATGAQAHSPSWVGCAACDVMGPMRAGAVAARQAWNQRARPAPEA